MLCVQWASFQGLIFLFDYGKALCIFNFIIETNLDLQNYCWLEPSIGGLLKPWSIGFCETPLTLRPWGNCPHTAPSRGICIPLKVTSGECLFLTFHAFIMNSQNYQNYWRMKSWNRITCKISKRETLTQLPSNFWHENSMPCILRLGIAIFNSNNFIFRIMLVVISSLTKPTPKLFHQMTFPHQRLCSISCFTSSVHPTSSTFATT